MKADNRQMNESNEPIAKPCQWDKIKIHVGYIISILIVIIIFLLTKDFKDNQSIASTINFAVGMVSVVLAVVAIVYSFIANASLQGSVTEVNSASSSIKGETVLLHQSLKNVLDVVGHIPDHLKNIENKLVSMASKQATNIEATPIPDEASIIKFARDVVDRYMLSSSWNGIKLLYLCHLAAEKNIGEFDLREWKDPSASFDYVYGYLVASASASFVVLTDNNAIIKIHSLPTYVVERLLKEVAKRKEIGGDSANEQIVAIERFVMLQGIYKRVMKPANPGIGL
jgi:hypothetical protein